MPDVQARRVAHQSSASRVRLDAGESWVEFKRAGRTRVILHGAQGGRCEVATRRVRKSRRALTSWEPLIVVYGSLPVARSRSPRLTIRKTRKPEPSFGTAGFFPSCSARAGCRSRRRPPRHSACGRARANRRLEAATRAGALAPASRRCSSHRCAAPRAHPGCSRRRRGCASRACADRAPPSTRIPAAGGPKGQPSPGTIGHRSVERPGPGALSARSP